ncbi:hypothetical protein FH972_002386 [Carpinus fangiana]|uniref:F-box domain-containing protein n=1 Tax=Carpinus fangiana TaxID=176857 RepID=A0A5N6QEP5_9ROSI|nr:hypothetical protein FH972_002386 [Carpinus fangiana]
MASSSSSSSVDETQTLIPGLPNDVASLILYLIPYCYHARLRPTCRSWRVFLTPSSNKSLLALRRRNRTASTLLCIFPQDPSISSPFLFDPHNLAWSSLPTAPPDPHCYGLCNFAAISLGPHLYVLGGSLFDTRSFPIDRPTASSSASRFDFVTGLWELLSPMAHARGSFACAVVPGSEAIIVAGGGSRHCVFAAAGSRISSVESYDVERDQWVELDRLPGLRAGCVGFVVEERMEFWVMGGYGEERTIDGVLPVDEYCRDAVVMELRSGDDGGKWRAVGDMWGDRERERVGKIVVVEDEEGRGRPGVFMLEGHHILRYDMASNRWRKESQVPKKAPHNSSFGFVVLDGELHVMTLLNAVDTTETRRKQHHKMAGKLLYIQIYHPKKKTWRFLTTKSPFRLLDFNAAVMCSVRL